MEGVFFKLALRKYSESGFEFHVGVSRNDQGSLSFCCFLHNCGGVIFRNFESSFRSGEKKPTKGDILVDMSPDCLSPRPCYVLFLCR